MKLETGEWYCAACQRGGGIRSFLKLSGLSHSAIEAVVPKTLKGREERPKRTLPRSVVAPEKSKSVVLPEALLGLYRRCPKYMIERGFEKSILKAYDIGYDSAHARVTAPIRDRDGRLIGIVGRTTMNEEPRYKVYGYELDEHFPGYTIDGQAHLWDYHRVAQIEGLTHVAVVEGFTDALWCIQCGIEAVVALLGKSMSEERAKLLSSLGVPIVLMLDLDVETGDRHDPRRIATKKLRGRPVRFVQYPRDRGEKDPVGIPASILKGMVASATSLTWRPQANPWAS